MQAEKEATQEVVVAIQSGEAINMPCARCRQRHRDVGLPVQWMVQAEGPD